MEPMDTTPAFDHSVESRAPQTPETKQQISPSTQTPETISRKSASKAKKPTTRADWVNAIWADISGQLRRLAVISEDLFEGLLLRRDTPTGSLILTEVRKQYEELGNDRNLACVRVMSPEAPLREVWRLYWTIKRPRDPNVRQFHSETVFNPINNHNHLDFDFPPGQTHSSAFFTLPRFIQDFGPGPVEFDPEPETDFDKVMREIMTDSGLGYLLED